MTKAALERSTPAATMAAIVQHRYGSADVLQVRKDVARPDIADDEVLVRVAAAGVDRGMYHLMTGIPLLMRFIGFGLRRPKVPVPGSNLAGWVEAVGKDVTRFEPGDTDHVIDYTRDDFVHGRGRYDVIIDTGGNNTLSRLRSALTTRGTLVLVGGDGGGRFVQRLDRPLRARLLSPFVGQTLTNFIAKENAETLLVLNELIEAGKVTPVVDRTYPLAEAADAIRYFESGQAHGRIAITI